MVGSAEQFISAQLYTELGARLSQKHNQQCFLEQGLVLALLLKPPFAAWGCPHCWQDAHVVKSATPIDGADGANGA